MAKRRGGRRAARAAGARFVVITGLSGSGKSQAIRALEDLGYFCVDNLPIQLVPTLAELTERAGGDFNKVAIVADMREPGFLTQFPAVYRRLRQRRPLKPALIFLEAIDAALVRRFSETRRPHPLARNRSVSEGIAEERRRMAPIRALADLVVDTSDLTVHELRQAFMSLARGQAENRPLLVTLLSFGYKHGIPVESDLVFDVRCLPNPHFVPELRGHTGRDRAVVRYMDQHEDTQQVVAKLTDLLTYLIPHYVQEGKAYLTVAIGCTGGRHRSVMIAERLRKHLASVPNARLRVRHRDIDLGG